MIIERYLYHQARVESTSVNVFACTVPHGVPLPPQERISKVQSTKLYTLIVAKTHHKLTCPDSCSCSSTQSRPRISQTGFRG